MAKVFKMGKAVAERLSIEQSLAAREGAPRVFGANGFLRTWTDSLLKEGLKPFPVPSVSPRLMIRANREKLAYFLTYYVGAFVISPHLGEMTVEIGTPVAERLPIRLRAPYAASTLSLTLGITDVLRMTESRYRLLSDTAAELGVSVVLDRTLKEMTLEIGIPVFTSESAIVREESSVEHAAICSAVARAFADLSEV